MTNPAAATTTYTVKVPVFTTWATGTMRSTGVRSFEITEEATILGGCRAIDAAIEQCKGKALSDGSPEITPNPGELGWPIGN